MRNIFVNIYFFVESFSNMIIWNKIPKANDIKKGCTEYKYLILYIKMFQK